MKKSIILSVLLLVLIAQSKACLNYYYSVDNKGHLHSADDLKKAFNTNFNQKLIERKLKKIAEELKEKHDYKLLSDYAVLLLKAGKTKESIEILSKLSNHFPKEYQIATNLGTAYELNGEVDKAIEFISKGMALNPDSHEGSEWVHLKVLETKLQLKKDASFLSKNTVLNLSEKDENDSLVRNQILIQVRERFPFSPGPNPIMASLLIDLGDCFANTASIEFAKVLFTISKLYFGADKDLVDAKISEMLKFRKKFNKVRPEKRRSEGDNIRLSGILYKSMLDNNNISNYKIAWERILMDPEKLLSYVDLEKIADPKKKLIPEKTVLTTEVNEPAKEKKEIKITTTNYLNYLIFASVLVLLIGFLAYRKQTARSRLKK